MKFFIVLLLVILLSSSACLKENAIMEDSPHSISDNSTHLSHLKNVNTTSSMNDSTSTEIVFTYIELNTAQNIYIYIEGYEPPIYKTIFEQPVPIFLTEEQQNLYRRAKMLYPILCGSTILIDEIPREDETPHIPGYGELYTLLIDDEEFRFFPAYGRYEHWQTFEEMGLSIFTETYFEEISNSTFFEIYDHTFYRDVSRGEKWGYVPEYCPDTFELISQTETQIEFEVIGHYYTSFHPTANDVPEEIRYPIKMILTENGWRFELFNVAS